MRVFAACAMVTVFAACPSRDGGGENLDCGDSGFRSDAGLVCDGGETFTAAQAARLGSCGSGLGSCHGRAPFQGDLDLTAGHAYGQLVGVEASIAPGKLRVKACDPLGSFLVQKLTNTLEPSEGEPMPKGEGILWQPPDPEGMRVLECWIERGAPRD